MYLSAEHLHKTYVTKTLLNDASLYLDEREKIGIIGLNGTGKSTLLKILAGEEAPDAGTITTRRGARIVYLPQNPQMDDSMTVLEQIYSTFSPEFRQSSEYEVKSMLNRLGIADPEALIGTLSGGQKKRAALAAALIQPADVLILDEPTNHLDSEMVLWLEEHLRAYTGGLIMVTHDRYFLERVTPKIAELSRGKLYMYEGNYSRYLELKAERMDMELASERKRQAILRREYQWIMRGPRARGTKSKERTERYYALLEQDGPAAEERVQMAAVSSRLGKKLIEMTDLRKAYDGHTVIDGFSYNIQRSDRIGVVGGNGAGKSTLLNLISGRISPDSGEISVGETVKIGYFSQEGKELDPGQRVYDFITDIADSVKTDEGTFSASQLLERFLFTGEMQSSPIGKLSGGERRRLYLLSVLITAPNILLLDEPTNDLDIDTLTILEEYLDAFPGAVIAVSHDRYFLDKMADFIFDVSGDGKITRYNGNFSEYLDKRPAPAEKAKEDKPSAAKQPPRQKKLKLSFKEQKEWETIDADIAALEEQIAATEAEMERCASDYVRQIELSGQLEEQKAALDDKMERWMYLNELMEQIAAQES